MPDPQKDLPDCILPFIAKAQAKADATGAVWYIERNPTSKEYNIIAADYYRPTNRRRIIEFIAFPCNNGHRGKRSKSHPPPNKKKEIIR